MVRRRVLGKQLRLLREQAGLTLEAAAPKLDFSVSKLSRIENAQVVIDVHWVKSMLDVYDVGGARWTELLDLAREANQPGWWREYGLGVESMARISLPGSFYLGLEAEATRVQEYTSGFVSGLMQTADYARALMQAVPISRTASEVETLVAARVHRQHRLTSTDNPLELVAVVEEGSYTARSAGLMSCEHSSVTPPNSPSWTRSRCACCHPPSVLMPRSRRDSPSSISDPSVNLTSRMSSTPLAR